MRHPTTFAHTGARVRRVWAELDYAQRRLFEIRTGVPVLARSRQIDELEALYAESARR